MMVLVLMMLMMLMMLYNLSTDKQRVKRRDPVRPTWAVGSRRDTVVVYLVIGHFHDRDDIHESCLIMVMDDPDK